MFKRLLIPIDGSRCSERAVRTGLELARSMSARIVLAHVVTEPRAHTRRAVEAEGRLLACGAALLERWRRDANRDGVPVETRLVEGRDVAEEIAALADDLGCNLILMGTHGRAGADRALIGSVAERVARIAPTPVMLVRPDDECVRVTPHHDRSSKGWEPHV